MQRVAFPHDFGPHVIFTPHIVAGKAKAKAAGAKAAPTPCTPGTECDPMAPIPVPSPGETMSPICDSAALRNPSISAVLPVACVMWLMTRPPRPAAAAQSVAAATAQLTVAKNGTSLSSLL